VTLMLWAVPAFFFFAWILEKVCESFDARKRHHDRYIGILDHRRSMKTCYRN
jgi:hypothetical protein